METNKWMLEGHFARPATLNTPKPEYGTFLGTYQWLMQLSIPHMMREAISLWKVVDDTNGSAAEAISKSEVAAALRGNLATSFDEVPRAGTVLAVLARRARRSVPDTPQCALDWAVYGTAGGQPRLGDILCLHAQPGAYVGLYVGEDDDAFHCLGVTGNDRIGIQRIARIKLYAVRRPLYDCVRISAAGIQLNHDGTQRQV